MKFYLRDSIVQLGMEAIVVAKVSNVNPDATLTGELEKYIACLLYTSPSPRDA